MKIIKLVGYQENQVFSIMEGIWQLDNQKSKVNSIPPLNYLLRIQK